MTQQPDRPPVWETHPAVLPFLPLIYVAWADGDLTGEEISEIRSRLEKQQALPAEARAAVLQWLDSSAPPSPVALRTLLAEIRTQSEGLAGDRRRSLAEFGRAIAATKSEVPPETLDALKELEAALGMVGEEAARGLIPGHAEAPPPEAETPFDVARLQDVLDGEYGETRHQVKQILLGPAFVRDYGLSKEAQREGVFKWLEILAAEGLGALSYPPKYGGKGDMGRFAVAFETIALFDISLTIKYGVQFGLFGGTIHMLGTEQHHKRYLHDAGTLTLPGCFAMTELGHGSNVAGLETSAVYDVSTQEFIVHTPNESARKEYIGNAAVHGQLAVVFAQLDAAGERHGVHALIVPIRQPDGSSAPGVRIEDCGHKLGLNGVDNGRLWFDRVRVPRENLLNRFAEVSADGSYTSPIPSPSKRFFTMLAALVAGRVSVALGALSAMKTGLTIAIRYGARRRQFGAEGAPETRLLDYLTHQRRLLPHLACAYALHFALEDLVRRFVNRNDEDQREVETLAAGLKAYATWANLDALQTSRECCGGQGYMAENRFADLKADTDIFCTFEGDNTVLLQLVAKSLLTEYRRQFEDIRPFTMLKYIAGRAAKAVAGANPLAARNSDSAHLRSPTFQLDAFHYRENRLIASLARRLKQRIDGGQDSFDAMTACQDHVVEAARAHVERIIMERFAAAVERCEDAEIAEPLGRLRSLFALSRIERAAAWFLETGYLSSPKSRAIRSEVNVLCGEVRPHATALADAFGIPDQLLGAPIAR